MLAGDKNLLFHFKDSSVPEQNWKQKGDLVTLTEGTPSAQAGIHQHSAQPYGYLT